jgi:Ca2+-binding RTX toxin-like protein
LVEALEGRRLFASVNLSLGVLTITGDSDGTPEDIWVARDSTNGVFVMIDGAQAPSSTTFFSNASISRIDVFGNGDGDGIYIESSTGTGHVYGNADVNEVASIEGGTGDDTIWGGNLADTLKGGDGNDFLDGTDSADSMYGGAGTDSMEGGDGNDTMYGGGAESDADTMWGEDGGDIMYGGGGADSMRGGNNNDVITGDGGNDTIRGDDGNDSMHGAADDDTFFSDDDLADLVDGGSGTDYHMDMQDDDDTLLSVEFP